MENHLGADFFEVASEEDVRQLLGAGWFTRTNSPEDVTIIADRRVQDLSNAVAGANEDANT